MELHIFDFVGLSPTVAEVLERVRATPDTEAITVLINSGGGYAADGEAIRAILAAAPNQIRVEIIGVAASAAMTIAMAGDEITATENSALMIHEAQSGAGGKASDLRSEANALDALNEGMTRLYAAKTGKSDEVVRGWLAATTWFTPAEALEAGLIDSVTPAIERAAARLEHTPPPKALAALALSPRVVQPSVMPFPATLLIKLGLGADATEEQVLAAIDAGLKPAPVAAPASLTRDDVVACVTEILSARDAAAAAAQVVEVQSAEEIHQAAACASVERFISEGKILPAGRDRAIAACGKSAATLKAAVAYWESAGRVVVAPVKTVAPVASTDTLTPQQIKMARDAGLTPEQFAATQKAMASGDPRYGTRVSKES